MYTYSSGVDMISARGGASKKQNDITKLEGKI